MEKMVPQIPHTLSPSNSGRRRCGNYSNSPEFEFWMVRNPSCPQPNLLSADELFVDGVLLPLHLLHLHPNHHSDEPPDDPNPNPPNSEATETPPNPETKSDAGPGPELLAAPSDPLATALGGSKRWRDVFKKSDRIRKTSLVISKINNEDKEREKKKERRASGGGGSSSAELNINLWPFSRSRSAGNGGNRPRIVSCSRSNSAGESKSRKWPNSPSRPGVHLGRSSPVWQVRRGASGLRSPDPAMVRNAERRVQKESNESDRKKPAVAVGAAVAPTGAGGGGGGGTKTRVLNLNVPMCIGYRQHLSCRSDESSAVTIAAGGGGDSGGQSGGSGGSGDGGRGGNLFNLRGLFTKKVF